MIKTIKWKDHNILGNLELDFYNKETGKIYNTIILAGENGTGKTTILETLAEFLTRGSFSSFDNIEYEIEGVPFLIEGEEDDRVDWGFHTRLNKITGESEKIHSNQNNNTATIEQDLKDIRNYGCVYSKANSNITADKIKTTTNNQLDSDKYDKKGDDFTSIKQLLVDIDSMDNRDWSRISRENFGADIRNYEKQFRTFRFKNSFNNFFETIKYQGIDDSTAGDIKVLFEKHGKQIPIDDLSTGEKQIVFRGAHLLKNVNSMKGGTVLIDEPELSMHPKWQEKSLQYYRSMFTPPKEEQSVQMIFATHSEYVVRAALEDADNVLVIMLKDENGEITASPITAPMALKTITAAEVNYQAFDIVSTDYHNQLYSCLQVKTGTEESIKDCDIYIASRPEYNSSLHRKPYSFIHKNGTQTNYITLPTYIRNVIDHPDISTTYTKEELKCSIELLIKLCV